MLDIVFSKRKPLCDGASRRDFLRLGAVGAIGLTLPGLLQAQSAARTDRREPRARSVILVYLGRGLSHHDSFDLMPEAPEEIRGM